MKNETNIYDIDGNIIRKAGDTHKFTIDEVEKLVDDLTEKVRNNPENEVYKVYLNNAQKWLFNMYNSMSMEDLKSHISLLQNSIIDAKSEEAKREKDNLEAINNMVEEFKAQYDKEKPETTIDEYVEPIEEIKE